GRVFWYLPFSKQPFVFLSKRVQKYNFFLHFQTFDVSFLKNYFTLLFLLKLFNLSKNLHTYSSRFGRTIVAPFFIFGKVFLKRIFKLFPFICLLSMCMNIALIAGAKVAYQFTSANISGVNFCKKMSKLCKSLSV